MQDIYFSGCKFSFKTDKSSSLDYTVTFLPVERGLIHKVKIRNRKGYVVAEIESMLPRTEKNAAEILNKYLRDAGE